MINMKWSSGLLVLGLGGSVVLACSSDNSGGTADASTPTSTIDAGMSTDTTPDSGPTGPIACASPPCADGDACVTSVDCASNDCVTNKCIPISCSDGVKNASETDIDCGGSCAKKCTTAQACAGPADCADGVCTTTRCVAATSGDGVKNGNESAIDCGSSTAGGTDTKAKACAAGLTCTTDADCLSGGCNYAGTCSFARSCVAEHGGTTCGAGDYGSATKTHEDCCTSAQVDNFNDTTNHYANPLNAAYRLDKYQITAGRIRTFLDAVSGNVKTWVQTNRTKLDTSAQGELPTAVEPYLPAGWTQPDSTDNCQPDTQSPVQKCNYGALNQISGYRYNDGPGGDNGYGCFMGTGAYGTRTSHLTTAELATLGNTEIQHLVPKERLDEKSVTCVTYAVLAAFCAWDGGHLETLNEYFGAFGGNGGYGAGRTYPYVDNAASQPDATRSLGFSDPYANVMSPQDNFAFTPATPPATEPGLDRWSVFNDNLTAAQQSAILVRMTRANHSWNYFDSIINDLLAPLQGRATAPIPAESRIDVANDSSVGVAPPGRYPLGAGKYGHRDLVGNVMEITATLGGGTYNPGGSVNWTPNGSFDYTAHFNGGNMIGYNYNFALLTKYGRAGGRCARPLMVYPTGTLPKTN